MGEVDTSPILWEATMHNHNHTLSSFVGLLSFGILIVWVLLSYSNVVNHLFDNIARLP